VQYDSPARILTAPADDFVARFVGTDRGLKALTLRRLADLPLEPADAARDVEAAPLAAAETLHAALSALMASGSDRLPVADGDGRLVGTVTLDLIRAEAGRPAPGRAEDHQVEPDAGPAASASAEGGVA
jgi:osmoprotectant transport system ATP-binding protein